MPTSLLPVRESALRSHLLGVGDKELSLLTLERVTKRFDRTLAVDDLSFSVAPATVFGFLGGNGAGKTTSLRMVLDIIRPTSGRIEVLGRAPGRANAPEIGFLPEERGLYRQMTALDTIAYFGRLKGMTASDAKREGAALLDRFGLAANSKMTVDKLSKGMAQKVQLATALVNRPRLLILDEPFSGLDPVNQGLLEEEIRRHVGGGIDGRLLDPRDAACRAPLRPAAAARARPQEVRRDARRSAGGAAGAHRRRREADPSELAGCRECRGPRRGRATAGGAGTCASRREWRQATLLERCTAEQFPLRQFEQLHASLHDVFVHIVGSAEASK